VANTRDIRRRIKSVKNTAQITKAMQLVAASKMKKAQDQALAGRRYAEVMNRVLVNLTANCDDDAHPMLEVRVNDAEGGGSKELVVVISTDKGLCGGLNTNLLRKVTDESTDSSSYVTVGTKGKGVLARAKKDLIADFPVKDPVVFTEVKAVAKFVTEKFIEGEVDTVKVAFTNFVNTISQEPYISTLLPISATEMTHAKEYEGIGKDDDPSEIYNAEAGSKEYLFEPTANEVLDDMLPHYVNYQLYQMVLEARASEHSARMVAMKSATDNAEGMIKDLTLEYNKVRQAAITNELLEITTAQMAIS
jgi:F-type H+-transporting ATPase subunit gamma